MYESCWEDVQKRGQYLGWFYTQQWITRPILVVIKGSSIYVNVFCVRPVNVCHSVHVEADYEALLP